MTILDRAVQSICKDFIPCPDSIPRPWSEMTQSEQAMTAWYCRRHLGAKDLEAVARHAVASMAQKSGRWSYEDSNQIFALFYPNE